MEIKEIKERRKLKYAFKEAFNLRAQRSISKVELGEAIKEILADYAKVQILESKGLAEFELSPGIFATLEGGIHDRRRYLGIMDVYHPEYFWIGGRARMVNRMMQVKFSKGGGKYEL